MQLRLKEMKSFLNGIIQYYNNQHKECQLIFEQYLR